MKYRAVETRELIERELLRRQSAATGAFYANKDNVNWRSPPLIGWTNDDMPELGSENTFQQIVSEMALAGFTGSEVGSKYPRDPAVLADADIRGHSDLQCPVQHLCQRAAGKNH